MPRRVGAGQLEIVPLDAGRRADFYRLHGDCNDAGWCACAAWWAPTWDGWSDRTAAENHAVRDALFVRGEHDGLLAYVGSEPVGWCQLGPRDRLAKLARQLALAPDPGAWAVTCFLVAPAWRGEGVARALLAAAAERARQGSATGSRPSTDEARAWQRTTSGTARKRCSGPPASSWRGMTPRGRCSA